VFRSRSSGGLHFFADSLWLRHKATLGNPWFIAFAQVPAGPIDSASRRPDNPA
jgi:hypothetical protein